MDTYEDVFDLIEHADMEKRNLIYKKCSSSFHKTFPHQFNNKDYKIIALRKYFVNFTLKKIQIIL